jgi:hypothetical protein
LVAAPATNGGSSTAIAEYRQVAPTLLPPPPQPPATSLGDISLLKAPLPPNNKPQPVSHTSMCAVCEHALCP